jgi:membrane associated rhomboid family serine protease
MVPPADAGVCTGSFSLSIMTDDRGSAYDQFLRLIATAMPQPWYPADFAKSFGVERSRIDPPLDDLRMAGLIELTPWISGKGQGYQLTNRGIDVTQSPRMMARIREGRLPKYQEEVPKYEVDPHLEGTTFGRGEMVRASLLNRVKPRVTQVLIAINILVFAVGLLIAMRNGFNRGGFDRFLIGGDPEALHKTGSIRAADLLNGEWWRLFTCCFVHFGLLHLFMNMYSLWVVGPICEQIWGRIRFLLIYLIAGLGGSCAAMWHPPAGDLAGASGALWGILASLPTWLLLNRAYLPRSLVSDWLRQLISVLILNAIISFIPGISREAHFGGGAVGALVAALLNFNRFGRGPSRWIFALLVALVPVFCVGMVVRAREHWPIRGRIQVGGETVAPLEEEEMKKFRSALAEPLRAVRKQSDRVEEEFNGLRKKGDERPQAEEVFFVKDALPKAQSRIKEAQAQIDGLAGIHSAQARIAVQSSLQYLEKQSNILNVVQAYLKRGKGWTPEENQKLDELIEEKDRAWNRCQDKLPPQ